MIYALAGAAFVALVLIVQYFPFGIFSGLPIRFLSDLDESLIVSLLVADVPIGAFIAVLGWRFLGERKLTNIAQAEAMAKYGHLKIITKEKKQYVLNQKTSVAYQIPDFIKKLASEDVIEIESKKQKHVFRLKFEDDANLGIYVALKEPTTGELNLGGL